MIIKICPKHKKKYAMDFVECPHYPEDCCDCEFREEEKGYWSCSTCVLIADKKRSVELKKTTEKVVKLEDVILEGRKIKGFQPMFHVYFMPHGGTKIRKSSFARINRGGYIEKCEKENAMFIVL